MSGTLAGRPRLRIAFVYDALVPYCTGGAERRFHELAMRLAIRHDVHYVTWRYWGNDPILIQDSITYHGIGAPRAFYGADGRRTVREQADFAARVPGALLRIQPDVIDISATPFLPVYTAWFATRLSRTPLVATWHEYWGEHWETYLGDRRGIARLARAGEAAARPLADRRVAVSEFTARRLAADSAGRAHGGSLAGIDVVPNGVDLGQFLGAGSTRPSERPVDVAFVGRLIAEKRVDLLVRAIAMLKELRPGIRCEIIGDGPERGSIAALVEQLGVTQQVALTGRVSEAELPGRLGSARLVAMPSAREGYGITVVEGQAVGAVPIVAQSPLSAAPDLVADRVDGLVLHPTAEAFASAIGRLLDDPAELERLSSAARNTAAIRGWDDRAADMEHVYVAVVAGRRRRQARTGGRRRVAELLHRAART